MAHVPADERRRQLVAATITLLTREGMAAASVRRISEEAGVPLGIVHYCFGSKRALLAEVIRELNTETLDAARRPIERGLDTCEAFRRSFRTLFDVARHSPELQLLTYELTTYALRDPALAGLATDQHQQHCAAVAELLAGAADELGIRWTMPVTEVAEMAVAAGSGTILGWLNHRDDAAALATLDAFADQLAGYAAAPEQAS